MAAKPSMAAKAREPPQNNNFKQGGSNGGPRWRSEQLPSQRARARRPASDVRTQQVGKQRQVTSAQQQVKEIAALLPANQHNKPSETHNREITPDLLA